MISRLLLFIFGIVFNVQVWDYAYDAESLVPNQGNVEFESQYQHYDDIPNLCYRCIDPSVKKLQENALSGSFFAFEVGFVATKDITVSRSRFPESAQHIDDAIEAGQPSVLTINRAGANANRRESLRGVETKPGLDRDEFPPAMFQEGGAGASVRRINSSDNRGAGSSIGAQCQGLECGTRVKIKTTE